MAANEDIRAERPRGPDPYEDEPEDDFVDDDLPPKRSGRVLPIVVASLAILGFVVIVYYAYQQGIRAGSEQNPPIIKAEEGPTKIRPSTPGGMDVPNQGMKVYELGKPGAQQAAAPGGVERILPKAEEPMPRPPAPPEPPPAAAPATPPAPQAAPSIPVQSAPAPGAPPASATTAAGSAPMQTSSSGGVVAPPPPPLPGSGQPMPTLSDTAAAAGAASTRANGPSAPTAPPPAPPPRDDAQAPLQARGLTLGGRAPGGALPPIATPTPSTPPQAAAPAAPAASAPRTQTAAAAPSATSAGGGSHVQLLAGKSPEEASAGWKRISAKHKDLLGSLGMETQTIDVAGKGTFYRVLAGPVSKPEAEKLCETLKGRGQDCIVR